MTYAASASTNISIQLSVRPVRLRASVQQIAKSVETHLLGVVVFCGRVRLAVSVTVTGHSPRVVIDLCRNRAGGGSGVALRLAG